jgi:hypothetical protein
VVTSGDAWIRGKGLTIDVETKEEYHDLLDRLPELEPLDQETTDRARAYAFHYFFRRMIPLSSLDPAGDPRVAISSLDELYPGQDPGLDTILDGVLHNTPFVFNGS